MFEQLENLLNLYKNNSSKFRFDNDKSNIIEFCDKEFGNLLLSISLNNINNFYYIFLYIEEESKIIFKGLIQKSESNIKNLYDEICNDLSLLDLESFISKYHLKISNNF